MKTVHLDPAERDRASLVIEEIDRLLGEGQHIAVTVAEEQELLARSAKAPRIQPLADPARLGTRVRGAPRTRS
jgi:hypothetical protein